MSFDPTGGEGNYYVSTQIGEDLVTNPDALSVPEELLLNSGRYAVLAPSNQVEPGKLLMSNPQLFQLREHLEVIHDRFEALYGIGDGERFAIEIEFKITSDDILAIKQARPWIFDPISVRTSPTTYSPDDVVSRTFVTRAQMAVLLSRLYTAITGEPAPASTDLPFTDVPPSAHQYVAHMYELGITSGTSPTTYSPNNNVTRAQMAVFLSRLYTAITGEPAPASTDLPFTDVPPSSPAHQYVAHMYELGITSGTSSTTYSPNNNVTRAQITVFMFWLLRRVDAVHTPLDRLFDW